MRGEADKLPVALAEIAARAPPADSLWRHRASGEAVRVTGAYVIEESVTPGVLYVTADLLAREPPGDVVPWGRPLDQFLDRFDRVPEA